MVAPGRAHMPVPVPVLVVVVVLLLLLVLQVEEVVVLVEEVVVVVVVVAGVVGLREAHVRRRRRRGEARVQVVEEVHVAGVEAGVVVEVLRRAHGEGEVRELHAGGGGGGGWRCGWRWVEKIPLSGDEPGVVHGGLVTESSSDVL